MSFALYKVPGTTGAFKIVAVLPPSPKGERVRRLLKFTLFLNEALS